MISAEGYLFAYARFTNEEVVFILCSMEETDKELEIPISYFGITKVHFTEDYLGTPINYRLFGQNMKVQCPAGKTLLMHVKLNERI